MTDHKAFVTALNPNAPARFHSVDPGVAYYAIAKWLKGDLVEVSVRDIDARLPTCVAWYADHLVLETPIITKNGAYGRARKSDVINLAFTAGRIADRYPSANVIRVTPAEWKGQLTKKIDHARSLEVLTADERRLIDAVRTKEERGHIMDAVGIGLKYLWRR